jgi:hypothetical protein
MAQKTYLQLVNEVLRNMRQPAVASLVENELAIIVSGFVNQAKEAVEDAWRWRSLTCDYTFTTVANKRDYYMDGTDVPSVPSITAYSFPARFANERSYLLRDELHQAQVWDRTTSEQPKLLREMSAESGYAYELSYANVSPSTWLYAFSYYGGHRQGIRLPFDPAPNRTLYVRMIVPQEELALTGTTLIVPWRPVTTLATAMAFEERGEELGPNGNMWMGMAQSELGKAISRDVESDLLVMVPS